jgi:hypothetical protein
MGFSNELARTALALCEKDLDRAIVLLLEDPERVHDALRRQEITASSNNINQGANWTPMNFFEQKIANNPKTKDNLKKLGSWIDKAKSQIEDFIDTESNNRY